MPRKPRPPDPGEPEPEYTVEVTARVEVTFDGKSIAELEAELEAERLAVLGDEPQLVPLPKRGDKLRTDKAPAFARVRVTKLGSFNTIGDDTELLGTVVILWTGTQENHNPFGGGRSVRGVLTPDNPTTWRAGELSWLSADGEVELIDPPTYIGQPEDFIPATAPVDLPEKTGSDRFSNWPPLIWDAYQLYRAMAPLTDEQSAIEIILCALKVAPPVAQLQAFLLSGLKARYAEYAEDTFWNDPWVHAAGPDWLNGFCAKHPASGCRCIGRGLISDLCDFDADEDDVEPEDDSRHGISSPHSEWIIGLEWLMDREDIEEQIEKAKESRARATTPVSAHPEIDDAIEELQAFLHSFDGGEGPEAFSGVGEAFCRAWHEGHRP